MSHAAETARRRSLAMLSALALGAMLGCGRSSLDVPEPHAADLDAALGDDAGTEIPLNGNPPGSTGQGDEGGTGASGQTTPHDASTPLPPPPTNDASFFFQPPPSVDASGANGDGSPGSGCGPATCAGCCLDGLCETAGNSAACGIGGTACIRCGPELTCFEGKCE